MLEEMLKLGEMVKIKQRGWESLSCKFWIM